eukprot:Clim_evm31s240 gene=Clim_evmTU31s240
MLVLFETPAGLALFKVSDTGKVKDADNIYKYFDDASSAAKVVKLKAFQKYEDTMEALASATALTEGKIDKTLKKFLKANTDSKDTLALADSKLGSAIRDKFKVKCQADAASLELIRCIRMQLESLITGLGHDELKAMSLGLSHSLSRYKLKFSPDKVDTMIVQAIGLLDDIDKELNTYAMRVREWYGWHFPELGKIVTDNLMFARTVKKMGMCSNAATTDLADILPEELVDAVIEAAVTSMGSEISEEDLENIHYLCDQVIDLTEYRAQLYDYLRNRMNAIAPNLTIMVGELVGARLIAHAGSLLNLAKQPASTIQILGAEKALFRALKTKHETPKYGLIYHASLVGQSAPKNKGKVSRVLAAKTALSARVDALGEKTDTDIGIENKAKVEARLAELEGRQIKRLSGQGKEVARAEKYETPAKVKSFSADGDVIMKNGDEGSDEGEKKSKKSKKDKKDKKRSRDDDDDGDEKKAKKSKKDKKEKKSKKDKK